MQNATPSLLLALASLTLSAGLSAARADEAGLYAAPPPPDAAFVRVLNGSPSAEANVTIGKSSFAVPPAGVSPYAIITKGDYDLAGAGALHVSLTAQDYYTVLLGADGTATLLTDQPLANPARAGLYFYNASTTPLELDAKVGGKQAAVFQTVPPGKSVFREVNAFEVAFTAMADGKPAFELPAVDMVRQQGLSVVALQDGEKISGMQAVNSVATAQ